MLVLWKSRLYILQLKNSTYRIEYCMYGKTVLENIDNWCIEIAYYLSIVKVSVWRSGKFENERSDWVNSEYVNLFLTYVT